MTVKLSDHKNAGTKKTTKERLLSFLEITTEMGNIRPQTFVSVSSLDHQLHQLQSENIHIYTICIGFSH